jgi:hypothetical protein
MGSLLGSLCGEYRSRTDDLLHAIMSTPEMNLIPLLQF